MAARYSSEFEIGNSTIRDIFYSAQDMENGFSLREIGPQFLPKLVRYVADFRKRGRIEKALRKESFIGAGFQDMWAVNIGRIARDLDGVRDEISLVDSVELLSEESLMIRYPRETTGKDYDDIKALSRIVNASVLEEVAHSTGYDHCGCKKCGLRAKKIFTDLYMMRTPDKFTIDLT
jgi:hypothetical protein